MRIITPSAQTPELELVGTEFNLFVGACGNAYGRYARGSSGPRQSRLRALDPLLTEPQLQWLHDFGDERQGTATRILTLGYPMAMVIAACLEDEAPEFACSDPDQCQWLQDASIELRGHFAAWLETQVELAATTIPSSSADL